MNGLKRIDFGPVAELRIENPLKLNVLTGATIAALEGACEALERDEAIRAVVVAAAPAKAFCAGADVADWGALDAREFARSWVRGGHRAFDRLARLSQPTVAAISGHAFGGGLELAAACDLRVIAPEATLALPEAKIGVAPGWSGTQRLTRLIGEPAVKEMALFGRRIDARRAHALGFVAEISEDPHGAAIEIARAALGLSSSSVEIAKAMIHAGVGEDRSAMIEALGSGMAGASEDRREGVAAFLEKRPPAFARTDR